MASVPLLPKPEEPVGRLQVRQPILIAGRPAGFARTEMPSHGDPNPIWFAALIATHCQARAKGEGEDRDVSWACISGRAVYTNRSAEEEIIEPLGVCLQVGHTIAVSWTPGDTTYTVEVFGQLDCVA